MCCFAIIDFFVVQNERVLFHYNGHGVPRPTGQRGGSGSSTRATRSISPCPSTTCR